MLESPVGAVVGATDVAAMAGFLAAFGFHPTARATVPERAAAALYGLDTEAPTLTVAQPGAARGVVRIVQTPYDARSHGPFDLGAHAFDVYTTDVERSLRLAAEAGGDCGPVGRVELGPLTMLQAEVLGPNGLRVVLIEANRRRPSLLDTEPGRLHSEGHSFIWAVASIDEALPFWRDDAGLAAPFDMPLRHPAISEFMRLPRPDVPLRMAMLCDEAVSPMRLELLQFLEDRGIGHRSLPLRGGLHAPMFVTADVDAAIDKLGAATFGDVVELSAGDGAPARAVRGVGPGGVVFELWSRA